MINIYLVQAIPLNISNKSELLKSAGDKTGNFKRYMNLTLELPGFTIYLKQPTDNIYQLLKYTDFQGTMINNTVV